MMTIPSTLPNLDHRCEGPISTVPYTCSLSPHFITPTTSTLTSFEPYWDIHMNKEHHLLFYNNSTMQNTEIESDSSTNVRVVNDVLTKALVDPWGKYK